VLQFWKQRNLSLYGKINIVKTLGLSKLIYNASVSCIPENFAKEVDKITFHFIWNNKPPKIKKKTIIGPKEQGGLNVVSYTHINKAIKLAWIKRLLDDKQSSWKVIPNNALLKHGGLFLFSCDFDLKSIDTSATPPFYKNMLIYLQEFNALNPNKETINKQCIWNNKRIKIGHSPIFYKSWFDKGIKNIEDLFDSNHKFLSLSEFGNIYDIQCNFLVYRGLISAVQNNERKFRSKYQ